MKRLRCTLAAMAAAGLLLSAAAAAAEHLSSPALPGFVVGHEAANAEQSIREEVPEGETVQNWTRMVTTQWFAGTAQRTTPLEFLGTMVTNLRSVCPEASNSRIVSGTRGGRPLAQMRAFCPMFSRTGQPEAFMIIAIAGVDDLHVKQVAFRRLPTPEDIAWGEQVLAAVRYCPSGPGDESCAS